MTSPLGTYEISSCSLCVCSAVQLCLTLCDPIDQSQPGSSVHGIPQASTLEWVAISFSGGSSLTQGLNPASPALAGRFLTTEPPRKPSSCSAASQIICRQSFLKVFIYSLAPGLRSGTWHFPCLLWHTGSLVGACGILAGECGI